MLSVTLAEPFVPSEDMISAAIGVLTVRYTISIMLAGGCGFWRL